MIDVKVSQRGHFREDRAEEFDSRVSEVIRKTIEEIRSLEESEIQVFEFWKGGECFDKSCDADCTHRTTCETKTDEVTVPHQ